MIGFAHATTEKLEFDGDRTERLLTLVRKLRVGGEYWTDQPELPASPYVLVATRDAALGESLARQVRPGEPVFVLHPGTSASCDPWHVLSGANHLIVDGDNELALVAAIAGVPLVCLSNGRFSSLDSNLEGSAAALPPLFLDAVGATHFVSPFTDLPLDLEEIIHLSGFWRTLIDSNRAIGAAIGFAFWKRSTVAPLLWNGSSEVEFKADPEYLDPTKAVAVWKSRTDPSLLHRLQESETPLIEVEDGFIRSAGLGADCVPPLSIVVDPVGIYFDPLAPSLLEQLIQSGPFAPEWLDEARRLRELIVSTGISKYGASGPRSLVRRSNRYHILVPGQVEDDRAVLCSEVKSNLELLRRVRQSAPEAHIIYKPHPDVEAGHRVGAIPDNECLSLADEIVRNQSMPALIDLVEELHVNSSLAGFEALLRSKPVTTHGVPFYAGWGLTKDLGTVPARRTAKRSLDELVAAALLLYPRYLDPVTGLPCPPDILIRRLAEGQATSEGVVVQLRRFQGRWKRKFAAFGRGAH